MRKVVLLAISLLGFSWVVQGQVKADTVDLQNKKGSTIVLFPDVQNYVKFDYNQPILELMTAWVAENKSNLNIQAVFSTGDLVDQNETLFPPFPRFGNLTSTEQWQFVSHAFSRLDGIVPYFISPGNHDYGYAKAENDLTNYPEYFPIERNKLWKSMIRASFPNRHGRITMENAAFEMKLHNWQDILVITTEFAPRDEVLEWIDAVSRSEAFKNHLVILLTHSYMTWDGSLIQKESYAISGANTGQQIWDKLLNNSPNIKLVVCGHFGVDNERYEYTTGFRQDVNSVGNQVSQMMFNTQTLGGGFSGNGGDGWLRLLEFDPDGKHIAVRTYSPLFGYSKLTKHLAWRVEPYDEFRFSVVDDPDFPGAKQLNYMNWKNRLEKEGFSFSMTNREDRITAAVENYPERWQAAFEFMLNADLGALDNGTYELKGNECYVTISEYVPRNEEQANIESHEIYTDIQMLIRNEEKMGLVLDDRYSVTQVYNPERDVAFYQASNISYHQAPAKKVFIFMPNEIHQPGVASNGTNKAIKKMVIKIKN